MAKYTKPKKNSSSSTNFATVSKKKNNKMDNKSEKAKHTYIPPGKDEICAKFEQSYLAHPQRAVIVHMCNECIDAAVSYKKEIKKAGRNCLVLPLCRACVFANRRCAQTLYFNTILKNKHDKGEDEDGDIEEGNGDDEDDDEEGFSGSDDDSDTISSKKSRIHDEGMTV